MYQQAIRIRTKIVKDTFIEDDKKIWERTTKSINITSCDDNIDLTKLHDKIATVLSDCPE